MTKFRLLIPAVSATAIAEYAAKNPDMVDCFGVENLDYFVRKDWYEKSYDRFEDDLYRDYCMEEYSKEHKYTAEDFEKDFGVPYEPFTTDDIEEWQQNRKKK